MKYDFDLENRKEARKQLIYKILLTVVEIASVIFAGFAITHRRHTGQPESFHRRSGSQR